MPVVAAVCPGQGSERPDMGRGFEGELLRRVQERTGFDVGKFARRGARGWDRTEVLQPLVVALGLTALEPLLPYVDVAVGHSLGELTAVAAAGLIDGADAVDLAVARGAAMADAARAVPGGLVWVQTDQVTAHLDACADAGAVVSVASRNVDGTVLAADEPGLGVLARRGGRLVQRLGPWHHPAMQRAQPAYSAALGGVLWRACQATWISEHDGRAHHLPAGPLAAQLTHPCAWSDALRALAEHGVTDVVVPPPGRWAAQQVRMALPEVRVHLLRKPMDAERIRGEWA